MEKDFDAIVVGAGPAGSAAAYAMAKDGLNVLMIERGECPGSKNMFGGMVYCDPISKVFPSFWEEAPIERPVVNQRIILVNDDSSVGLTFTDPSFASPPINSCTVLRSKFDRWLARKAGEAGALIMNDTVVDDLIWHQQKVVGVKVGRQEGEVYSDVVIIADGTNSLLVEKARLKEKLAASTVSLGVKELIALPEEVINERFNLSENKGAAYLYLGCLKGIEGGGFIYTNKKSLSIGIVCQLDGLLREAVQPWELIEEFKKSNVVRDLIRDGTIKEYSARLIPEGGLKAIPRLYCDGALVAGSAAGLVINNGVTLRGVDLAFASGIAAANTVKAAKEKGDVTSTVLCRYEDFLKEQFVLQDLKTYKNAPHFLLNRSLYDELPKLACTLGRRVFSVEDKPREKILALARAAIRENISVRQLIKIMIQAGRSL
jgi:electron transfer flavoprotein-quinone oxidoreductase